MGVVLESRGSSEARGRHTRSRAERRFNGWLGRGPGIRVLVFVVVAVVLALVLRVGQPAALDCGDSPAMVRLEFAGNGDRAADVLAPEQVSGADPITDCSRGDVNSALLWDTFVFIPVYALVLGAIAVAFGSVGYRMKRMRRLAVPMAGFAIFAGVMDWFENLALWRAVDRAPDRLGEQTDDWAFMWAAAFAWAKWLLLFVLAAYCIAALIGYAFMPKWIMRYRAGDEVQRPSDSTPARTPAGSTGIALSGGGVRSASFALGGMQALDGTPIGWERAGRVTSVSGGGYMAGGWSLARGSEPARADGSWSPPASLASGTAGHAEPLLPWADAGDAARRAGVVSPQETHLRRNLGYLLQAEGGRPGGVPTVLVGLLVNIVALGVLLYVLARPFGWLIVEFVDPAVEDTYSSNAAPAVESWQWWSGVFWLTVGAGLVLLWVVSSRVLRWVRLGWVDWLRGIAHTAFRGPALGALAIGVALIALLVAVPVAMVVVPNSLFGWILGVLGCGALATVWATVRGVFTSSIVAAWVPKLGGVLVAAVAVGVGGWWATNAAVAGPSDDWRQWAIVAGVAAVGWYAVSPEWWSVAPFYRGRLRRAYATRVGADGEIEAYNGTDEPLLSTFADAPGPLVRYCATMPVADDREDRHQDDDRSVGTHHGIGALSFTMDGRDIVVNAAGSATDGPQRWRCSPDDLAALMKKWESPKLNTMFAVGVSGASVAPSMGRKSMGTSCALLAFANVRLGVWLPHPRWAGVAREAELLPGRPSYPRVRLGYLLKEMFGLYDWDDLHVFVTDGDHWEGTAIVEMLRGGEVLEGVALDAGGGAADSLIAPAEAVSLASLELREDVDIDVEPLRAASDDTRGGTTARRAATVGLVRGTAEDPDGVTRPTIGVLWYARNVLTPDSSAVLWSYAERESAFPSKSIIDQFFDEEQFAMYRLLGFEAGEAIVAGRKALLEMLTAHTDRDSFVEHAEQDPCWAIREMARLIRNEDEYQAVCGILGVERSGTPRGTDVRDVLASA